MNREAWVSYADRLARPVLKAAAAGTLEEALALEHHPDADPGRLRTASLEAVGRTLSGIAPWMAADNLPAREQEIRDELRSLVARALPIQTDPAHTAYLRFAGTEKQTLVDAAFLAQGLLRGLPALWSPLDDQTRARTIRAMIDLRNRKPVFNNWLLFGAMTEAFLYAVGAQPDLMRLDFAIRQHEQWYLGDATYGDGPEFHHDYYNSYVIHPMLTDVLETVADLDPAWSEIRDRERIRLTRAAEIQERLIAPDGSFPVVGRSICYRCGAFQTLAQAALNDNLPAGLSHGQVRSALSAVIARTLSPDTSWRADGFLAIGLTGAQPSLGEPYITTGSLYLAACVLLPLGLPPDHPFWNEPEQPWTGVRIWDRAQDLPADHALRGS